MEFQIYEWLSVFFRWFHVIAAIAWIGASFYFVWLDNSLELPPSWKQQKGIKGDLWAFHGGGIYEVAKYKLAPEAMPSTLHWFKWEAYTTWITGTILLCIVYYAKADLYLVSPDSIINSAPLAISASILFIASGVVVYEILFRLFALKQNTILIAGTVAYIAFSCFLATYLFSDRAAFLHVGALIASIMAANVFLGVIPAQKGFIAALNAGEEPEEAPMLRAKMRSFHNNYFTLPVIFCMISNHYAFLYGHPLNWLVLIALLALTAYARHYFNLKHKGQHKPSILIISLILFVVLIAATGISKHAMQNQNTASGQRSGDSQSSQDDVATIDPIEAIIQTHCAACHAQNPTQPGFTAPPAGLIFDSLDSMLAAKDTVAGAINSRYMPLGNITGMTEEERSALLAALEK